jgi:hypothetical protein
MDLSPTPTFWFVAVTAILWLGYDIYLYAKKRETISEVIYKASKVSVMVPFITGLLCGHWFW